jgi:hypothetical protein
VKWSGKEVRIVSVTTSYADNGQRLFRLKEGDERLYFMAIIYHQALSN